MSFPEKLMELEITFSKITQTEIDMLCALSHMWNLVLKSEQQEFLLKGRAPLQE
jgi:hypothetical protein